MAPQITDRTDTLRVKLIDIKWKLDSNDNETYKKLKNNGSELLDYLNVPDAEVFKIKIYDAVKNMV